jgi:protein-tyrosine phosphatase
MARVAVADGTNCLVATPHDMGMLPGFADRVKALTSEVDAEMRTAGIEVQLIAGSELHAIPDLVDRIKTGRALTLGGSRYFLLEFPLTDLPIFAAQLVFEAQIAGLIPIVAHPARTLAFQREPQLLYDLVERGALAQVTSGSLTGDFGPQVQAAARELVEHGLVHVIATDAHGIRYRPPVLSEAVEVASDIVGEDVARAMVISRPRAILADTTVTLDPPRHYYPRRRWFWSR